MASHTTIDISCSAAYNNAASAKEKNCTAGIIYSRSMTVPQAVPKTASHEVKTVAKLGDKGR